MIKINPIKFNKNNRPDKNKFRCTCCNVLYKNTNLCYIEAPPGIVITICHSCLFNLYLELNDMFQISGFLDGAAKDPFNSFLSGVSTTTLNHLKNHEYIEAVQQYRVDGGPIMNSVQAYYNIGLSEAKEKIDTLRKLMETDLNNNFT